MVSSNMAPFWNHNFEHADHRPTSSEQNALETGIAFFGDVQNKDVLDIGCGFGNNSIALARLGANVTAVDISQVAIEKLNRKATELGLSIRGLVLDALRIRDL